MIRTDLRCQAELPSLPNAGHAGQIFKPGVKLTPDLQAERLQVLALDEMTKLFLSEVEILIIDEHM